ncbi:putative LuxR-family transcriptional regulator [Actinoplanes missouriensis 431]|uniref:Putative LuxR-family transcriptional regulator n=1 Tax=Actinoplanes missouriensis (strain ATCC 14538 / DSM 43046 / CBS 188.64 / JCM 3121 / NBRC 102363 / NCIMB 12654 / NRRL B-3342 / UNCC 431) TaxID=512565 RepID=I0H511_ACTM4|nr:putative LuxR-family transcriptional regulator [Actinoplanes missouriensis 431]
MRAARDTFDSLGTTPWGDLARQELRASGATSQRHTVEAHDLLTPQELQIAQMAADGMTNREIGERLYLSHRTVSTHLRRIFPKLGVTSRTQLGAMVRSRASRPV